jgi:exonuclease III
MLSLTIYLTLLKQNVESNPGMKQNSMNLSILTYNCNGLGDPKKLGRVLDKAAAKVEKDFIVCLQETHIVDTKALSMRWKYKFESNGYKTNSAGVIILYKNNLDLVEAHKDKEGRGVLIYRKPEIR